MGRYTGVQMHVGTDEVGRVRLNRLTATHCGGGRQCPNAATTTRLLG
jgi:hypothetical protein